MPAPTTREFLTMHPLQLQVNKDKADSLRNILLKIGEELNVSILVREVPGSPGSETITFIITVLSAEYAQAMFTIGKLCYINKIFKP